MFSGNTDPVPYIVASYIIGSIGIFGFAGFVLLQRKKLRQLLSVIDEGDKKNG